MTTAAHEPPKRRPKDRRAKIRQALRQEPQTTPQIAARASIKTRAAYNCLHDLEEQGHAVRVLVDGRLSWRLRLPSDGTVIQPHHPHASAQTVERVRSALTHEAVTATALANALGLALSTVITALSHLAVVGKAERASIRKGRQPRALWGLAPLILPPPPERSAARAKRLAPPTRPARVAIVAVRPALAQEPASAAQIAASTGFAITSVLRALWTLAKAGVAQCIEVAPPDVPQHGTRLWWRARPDDDPRAVIALPLAQIVALAPVAPPPPEPTPTPKPKPAPPTTLLTSPLLTARNLDPANAPTPAAARARREAAKYAVTVHHGGATWTVHPIPGQGTVCAILESCDARDWRLASPEVALARLARLASERALPPRFDDLTPTYAEATP